MDLEPFFSQKGKGHIRDDELRVSDSGSGYVCIDNTDNGDFISINVTSSLWMVMKRAFAARRSIAAPSHAEWRGVIWICVTYSRTLRRKVHLPSQRRHKTQSVLIREPSV